MAAVIDTTKANNELVSQTVTDVTAIRLNTTEGVSRPLPNGATWTKMAIVFRIATMDGPAAGNLGATRFCAGVCSSGARRGEAGEHFVGWDWNKASVGVYTNAAYTPTASAWYNTVANTGVHRRSGALISSAALSTEIHLVRSESVMTSPPGIYAHSWPGYVVFLEKGTPWTMGVTTAAAMWSINVPNKMHMMSGEQGGSYSTVRPRIDNIWTKFTGVAGTTVSGNLAAPQPDEGTYGTLDRLNFYWECATASVGVVIRDIQIIQFGE